MQVNVDTKKEITYRTLINNVKSLAAGLQITHGLKKGQCVALAMPNSSEFVVTLLALTYAGAVVSLINPVYNSRKYFFCDMCNSLH